MKCHTCRPPRVKDGVVRSQRAPTSDTTSSPLTPGLFPPTSPSVRPRVTLGGKSPKAKACRGPWGDVVEPGCHGRTLGGETDEDVGVKVPTDEGDSPSEPAVGPSSTLNLTKKSGT